MTDWQNLIDNAAGSAGTVVLSDQPGTSPSLPAPTIVLTETLKLHSPVELRGLGRPYSKWGADSAQATVIDWQGPTDQPAIVIGGTAASLLSTQTHPIAEGVTLGNLTVTTSQTCTAPAIRIDGSSDHDVNRGLARDIVLEQIDVTGGFDGGVELLGNTFNVRLRSCGLLPDQGAPFAARRSAGSNVGVDRPGQVFLYDTILWSMDGTPSELLYTIMFGGHVQGKDGVVLDDNSAVYGVHIEGDTGGPFGVGLHVMGRHVVIQPENVSRFATGIKVGDGSSVNLSGWWGMVPLLASCTTGVHVTAGGPRSGSIRVLHYQSNGTDTLDERGDAQVTFRGPSD